MREKRGTENKSGIMRLYKSQSTFLEWVLEKIKCAGFYFFTHHFSITHQYAGDRNIYRLLSVQSNEVRNEAPDRRQTPQGTQGVCRNL